MTTTILTAIKTVLFLIYWLLVHGRHSPWISLVATTLPVIFGTSLTIFCLVEEIFTNLMRDNYHMGRASLWIPCDGLESCCTVIHVVRHSRRPLCARRCIRLYELLERTFW